MNLLLSINQPLYIENLKSKRYSPSHGLFKIEVLHMINKISKSYTFNHRFCTKMWNISYFSLKAVRSNQINPIYGGPCIYSFLV